MEKHTILEGKVHVYKRDRSRYWQCSTFLAGKNRRASTKKESLSEAKLFAGEWYFGMMGKHRGGELKDGHNFMKAAEAFSKEYPVMTAGQRSPGYVRDHLGRIRIHLEPFFGKMNVEDINSGVIQDYRVARLSTDPKPSQSTLNHEMVSLRLIMKTAVRNGWIDVLPDMTPPYRGSTKITRRAWFSPDDYKRLYTATRERMKAAENKPWANSAKSLHDYILFMANTGMRPDEANNLEYRDVEIVDDEPTGETILVIEVRGKRGIGYCKSTAGAVLPFKRLKERNNPHPTDKVFPANHKKAFNKVLNELDLKVDRDGQRRTAYSLRHTYICFRLMEGADIYQIAKNCRTSVEMIEKHYASHIQNALDTTAINVRKKT